MNYFISYKVLSYLPIIYSYSLISNCLPSNSFIIDFFIPSIYFLIWALICYCYYKLFNKRLSFLFNFVKLAFSFIILNISLLPLKTFSFILSWMPLMSLFFLNFTIWIFYLFKDISRLINIYYFLFILSFIWSILV